MITVLVRGGHGPRTAFADGLAAVAGPVWDAILDARGRPDHEHYAVWIGTYASEEFTDLAE